MDFSPDDDHLAAMKRHARQRQRRYWMWMAFLPGIFSPVAVYLWILAIRGGDGSGPAMYIPLVYAVVGFVWLCTCAIKLDSIDNSEDATNPFCSGWGLLIALAFGNLAVGATLTWGACAVLG